MRLLVQTKVSTGKSLHLIIQQLVEAPLAALSWSNHFMYESSHITLSHFLVEEVWPTFLYNIVSVHWGLWTLVIANEGAQRKKSKNRKALNHHPCTTVIDSRYEVFVLICCVWLSPNIELWIIIKHFHFDLICLKDNVSDVLWFIQMQFYKAKLCFIFFLSFVLAKKSFFVCTSMKFNI